MKCLAASAHLMINPSLEMIVFTVDHTLVSPPASLIDTRLRTTLLNRFDASNIGYYLSVNTNCFLITFAVERGSTLPASWVSTRNKEDNVATVSRSAGERYLR